MSDEADKKPLKIAERKFAVPMGSLTVTFLNDLAGLGLPWWALVILVGGSLGYAAIETWHDIARMKYGAR